MTKEGKGDVLHDLLWCRRLVTYTARWPRVSGGSELLKRYSPLLGGVRDSSLDG